ncbi:OapA family protein [Cycloclasticus pugetii]|uniref:OapA family protein n=1 Tax=Cycloclasticus pugetii TaxID=34068 RepID=UPI0009161484|nr:peptidoglycan DD-metalloendopeptidase family protein [Cycloclasticus pugetii]SHJ15347.1 Murein DD-endopeptidase MepM and murein hydrolase activator NlpD, contain LysM domain [Cycloclasticus pugetii]
MMKSSLINRDFKTPISPRRYNSKKARLITMLLTTIVMLGIALYFKNATGPSQASLSTKPTNNQHVVSIDLPEKSSDDFSAPTLSIVKHKTAPLTAPTNTAKITGSSEKISWKEYTIKPGDSLAKIFNHLNYSATTLHNIIQLGEQTQALKKIRPGQTLRFAQNADGECVSLEYDLDQIKTLRIETIDNDFAATVIEKPVEVSHAVASADINNSLFYDAKQVGVSDKTIMELANIFGWDIDFTQGLRQGDSFSLLYESKSINGKRIENGPILAAEFINRGNKYQAVRFTDKDGNTEYFSPDGKSMRKTFLRNPIDFARVSSHFNLRRKHPVLNRIRAHKGVDYAASTGTPIRSTGDGKIIFRGIKGGYGRVVIVQHGQKYSSLYAHMSKYGRYKKGSHIKQGQIVGYVGMSGLVTGPHLHYELRVNGVHRNPLTTKFPAAEPINKNLLAEFKNQTSPLLAQLALAKKTQLALK